MSIKIGTQVGNWLVVSEEYKAKNILWFDCECICGTKRPVRKWWLKNSLSKGCGCTNIKGRFKAECIGDLSKSYFGSFKYNRLSKNIIFSEEVDMNYLWKLFLKQNKKCALSGLDIFLNPRWSKQNKGFETEIIQTASVDRINSSLGYVVGNVQWVHKSINLMKGQLLDQEFITICKIVAKNNNTDIDYKLLENLKWRPNIK